MVKKTKITKKNTSLKHYVKKNSSTKKVVSSPRSIFAIIALIFVVILISSLVTIFLLNNSPVKPFKTLTLDYDFQVTPSVSFVLDKDILHFGGGPANSRLQRAINLTSPVDATLNISWVGDGNLIVSNNSLDVLANQPFSLLFFLDVPSDLPLGNYSGKILFKFYST